MGLEERKKKEEQQELWSALAENDGSKILRRKKSKSPYDIFKLPRDLEDDNPDAENSD
jgi:hypothetical protein